MKNLNISRHKNKLFRCHKGTEGIQIFVSFTRWINDVCESNEVPHFYGCEIQTNQLLDLTNIVNGRIFKLNN